MTDILLELPPLHRLITAYAPKVLQEGMRHIWVFDARLANIVRTTSEPMIGQMRLTWWHEALSQGKGAGDPLLDALRADVLGKAGAGGLLSAIEGWEVLLEPLPLSDGQLISFAEHRPREPNLLAVQQPRAVTRRTILYTRSPEAVLPPSDSADGK